MSELIHWYHALGACFNPQTNMHNLHLKSFFTLYEVLVYIHKCVLFKIVI